MADFRELREHELQPLSDDELIAYLRAARSAGRDGAMKLALSVLVYGYWDTLLARARLKLSRSDAEDVAQEAVASAIVSAFDGKSVGEFKKWVHTILSRRIADYHEARKRRPQTQQLPSEGDDEYKGHEPAEDFEGNALHAQECVRKALEELEERHRKVIELHVFGHLSAVEAAAQVDGMSDANVHQIASRFQRRVLALVKDGDTS